MHPLTPPPPQMHPCVDTLRDVAVTIVTVLLP